MWVKVAETNSLEDGEAKTVHVNGRAIALYKINNQFFATTNTCPHKGGPLGEGFLEDKIINCPWHGWKFDVTTGVAVLVPTVKIKTYKVKVEGNDVMVEVE